ncbi:hypothetical protein LJR289_003451 [Pseudoduganella sp. LjRoot289]|uniref:type IV pilus assembly protein FimV n=1 Tax=Pseudoduganella sp. LjRoot289 TaxID=3342314 RepID=UPI003ED0841F
MQLRFHRHFVPSACVAALAAGLLAGPLSPAVSAAELGEVAVRSHIGQQLSADIELVMLTPEDAAGVQVKLAAPNVYLGANTQIHPALSSLRMSVMKRDNRQFLHLTTVQPVDAEILHLFLELGTGSRSSVRSATLWLTAEPLPAPKPAPLRPPVPESASAVADMMAADAALAARTAQGAQAGKPTQTAQTAASAEARAVALRAARLRAAAQNGLATTKEPAGAAKADRAAGNGHATAEAANPAGKASTANPAIAASGTSAAANSATTASGTSAAANPATGASGTSTAANPATTASGTSTAAAAVTVKPGPAAVPIKLGAEARAQRSRPGRARAACTPGQPGEEAQQCLALDQTNAELKTKLVDLESKVKQLQAALGQGAAVAAVPATVPGPAGTVTAAATLPGPAAVPASAPGPVVAGAASAAASPLTGAAAAAPAASPPANAAKAAGKKKAAGINTATLIAAGALLLALVLGLAVYLIRKKKIKFSTEPLKVWQGWRKDKKPAEAEAPPPAEPILGDA